LPPTSEQQRDGVDEQGSGSLSTLTKDASPLAISEAAPDAIALALFEREFQANLANSALLADLLRLIRVVFRDGVEDVGVKSLAGCSLSPSGVHQLLFLSSRDMQLVARYRAKGTNRSPLKLHLAVTPGKPSKTPRGETKGPLLCYARARL
jgi:hypothetical protein